MLQHPVSSMLAAYTYLKTNHGLIATTLISGYLFGEAPSKRCNRWFWGLAGLVISWLGLALYLYQTGRKRWAVLWVVIGIAVNVVTYPYSGT